MSAADARAAFRVAIDRGLAPGGQLSIWRDGAPVLEDASGLVAAGEGATSLDVVYDLASLTKILATTYLAARALQYGLCALEDAIVRFVPHAPENVTVRQLLEHAAGYAAHLPLHARVPNDMSPQEAHALIVREAARAPLVCPPDTKIIYSDLGFIVLGAALERMFAEPISALVTRQAHGVFFRDVRAASLPHDALEYAPTAHLPLADNEAPVAVPRGVVHDPNARAMGGAAGHAGLFGTATAVSRLMQRWLAASRGDDDAWLRRETVATMWAPSRVPGRARGFDKPSPSGSHTGDVWPADTIGHLGFTGTSAWLSPSLGLSVVLVTNRGCTLAELKAFRREIYAAALVDLA
ncbi:MAG: beta-lactamase family protein [Deltaproteobacteria bacterium]|nr:beta-lactamase family protein [Deltaproteobacteria bacterium]